MSKSLYYSATRKHQLTDQERQAVDDVLKKHSVDERIERRCQTGEGPNWESFSLYGPPLADDDTILEGSTKPPNNSEEAFWQGLLHLCAAVSELRRLLPDAVWRVHLDDHDIHWDESQKAYDPSV